PSDSTMAAGMAAYAIQKGYTNCAMVFDTSAAAQSLVPYVRAAYSQNGGTLAADLSLAPDQTSYRSEVVKLQATKPQCLFMQTGDPTAVTFFADMVQLGALTMPVVSTDTGADAKFATAMGWSYATKLLTGMNGAPPAGPAYSNYVKEYQKVWNTNQPLTLSENGYDGIIEAALAMTAAKSTDPKVWYNKVTTVTNPPGTKCYTYSSCVDLLKAGTKINYEGATGPEDFNQYHNVAGEWSVVRFDDAHNLNTVANISAATVTQYSRAFAQVK
ncbi:MAG: ABC transporter substrate-binding protein, partial [Acidimicrobiales bacterium]